LTAESAAHFPRVLRKTFASLGKEEKTMNLLTKIKTLRHVRPAPEPDLPDVAHAVAIIMDGNARWARKRGLPIAAGHRAGT
jgi:undecaprenyl pyrophosphate synthase